jgi:hypothetical protein
MLSSLSLADVTRVANEAVKQGAPGYEVVGVTVNDGHGDYVEVLIRVLDCERQPCMVSVGIFRDVGETALRKEITEKLKQRGSLPPHPARANAD